MMRGSARVEYSETVPFQYQQGHVRFMGAKVMVDPRVLIPRPETELLVKAAVDILAGRPGRVDVLDMCTGSGAVAIALSRAVPAASVTACDVSRGALSVARKNIQENGLGQKIDIRVSDMFKSLKAVPGGAYDAIVSNPPYVSERDFDMLDPWVKAEPAIALYGGRDGMDYLNILCEQAPLYLKKDGFLAVEIGYDQSVRVREKMSGSGLKDVRGLRDYNGYDRVIVGRKNA